MRNDLQVHRAVLLRGRERPEASSPLEGFLTSRSIPYGIPLLDMPCIGSQGAQGEGRSRTHSAITEQGGVLEFLCERQQLERVVAGS